MPTTRSRTMAGAKHGSSCDDDCCLPNTFVPLSILQQCAAPPSTNESLNSNSEETDKISPNQSAKSKAKKTKAVPPRTRQSKRVLEQSERTSTLSEPSSDETSDDDQGKDIKKPPPPRTRANHKNKRPVPPRTRHNKRRKATPAPPPSMLPSPNKRTRSVRREEKTTIEDSVLEQQRIEALKIDFHDSKYKPCSVFGLDRKIGEFSDYFFCSQCDAADDDERLGELKVNRRRKKGPTHASPSIPTY